MGCVPRFWLSLLDLLYSCILNILISGTSQETHELELCLCQAHYLTWQTVPSRSVQDQLDLHCSSPCWMIIALLYGGVTWFNSMECHERHLKLYSQVVWAVKRSVKGSETSNKNDVDNATAVNCSLHKSSKSINCCLSMMLLLHSESHRLRARDLEFASIFRLFTWLFRLLQLFVMNFIIYNMQHYLQQILTAFQTVA